MLYEIKGIGFPNKGAELMLVAVLEEVRRFDPEARFCVVPETPYADRGRYGLLQKVDFSVRGVSVRRFGGLIPQKYRTMYGLVPESEVDIVLDASGYAYGDPWGAAKAKIRLADHIVRYRKQGKTVILLPQAFGPFSEPALRDAMGAILENANLIFARDSESFGYLASIRRVSSLLQAPDFTNLVSNTALAVAPPGDVAVIPNQKMITSNTVGSESQYVAFMVRIIARIVEQGRKPFLLIHEGHNDQRLAEKIIEMSGESLPIRTETDVRMLKTLIGNCRFVVSDRFHGIVSALSQGIPVIVAGWSHKYRTLLKDYQCESGLLEVDMDDDAIHQRVDQLTQSAPYRSIRKRILEAATREKEKSRDMWDHVFACIESHRRGR